MMETTSDTGRQRSGNVCCSICLEDIDSQEQRAVCVPCGHEFHYDCVSAWTRRHNDCSLCRQKVHTIRYHIESDFLYDEDEVTGQDEDQFHMLEFAYTPIGNGIFLHSLLPFQVFEIINSTHRTVRLENSLRASSTPIHAGSNFQLEREHLNELAHLTIETATASFSLATALLRLQSSFQNQGENSRGVFTERRSLSLLDRVDGTLRLLHSHIPAAMAMADNESDSSDSRSSSPDADDCASQRMLRRERRSR